MTEVARPHDALVAEVRQLIADARRNAAVAVNAELTWLYWQVGQRIHREVLGSERADYGEEIVATLARQLAADYGPGFSVKNLRHMVRFAQVFPDEAIVSALRRQLSWTHLKTLIYVDDTLKRDSYLELCRLEGWSSRQLQERIQSLLYERSAISRQPDETIQHDLTVLRQEQRPSPTRKRSSTRDSSLRCRSSSPPAIRRDYPLLHDVVPRFIAKWEPILGVTVKGYFLLRMKTKWGGCNHRTGTIRLNTELVKKPRDLLEYVVVHEMLHLVEPTHNERHFALLDRHYPAWREARSELNELPLAAETWGAGDSD